MHLHRPLSYLLLLLTTICINSCGDSKNNTQEDIWVAPVPVDTVAVLHSQNINGEDTISGKKYYFKYKFAPSDSLPEIKSFSGQRYKDNEVDLTVRNDSSQILKKHFTKRSFSDLVPPAILKKSSLIDFYYNYSKENKGTNLYFIAIVGDPEDNDENSHFIEIRVSRDGEIHMEKAKMEDLSTLPLDQSINESSEKNKEESEEENLEEIE